MEVDTGCSLSIPSMLLSVWDKATVGRYKPMFRQNVCIQDGILQYEIPSEWQIKSDYEVVENAQ